MLVASVLFSRTPVSIPESIQDRAMHVEPTSAEMVRAADWLMHARPDRIVVLSPQAPRLDDSFSLSFGQEVHGTFKDSLRPHFLRFPLASSMAGSLCSIPVESPLRILPVANDALDLSSATSLYFLAKQGWHGPVLILGFPFSPSSEQCRELGQWLAEVSLGEGGRTVLCVLGDLKESEEAMAAADYHSLISGLYRHTLAA